MLTTGLKTSKPTRESEDEKATAGATAFLRSLASHAAVIFSS
jgi:hypothetical protein